MQSRPALAALAVLAITCLATPTLHAQDEVTRGVTNGGIFVPGWTGRVDASEAAKGLSLDSARLAPEGSGLRATTGPAVIYWNPANTVSGDYTVKATFTEENYMSLNSHPHPYGIFVGGHRMGTDQQSYLYCAAYGNGRFIVRGFGPAAFQMNGRGEVHEAVNKAAGPGQPVTQEIAITVRGSQVSCAINGTTVASYERMNVVTPGKLTSTDGIYGIRFGHNTSAIVTGLSAVEGIRVTK